MAALLTIGASIDGDEPEPTPREAPEPVAGLSVEFLRPLGTW